MASLVSSGFRPPAGSTGGPSLNPSNMTSGVAPTPLASAMASGTSAGGPQPLILLLTEVWGVEAKTCWDQPLAEPQIQEACHLSSRCLWNYLPLGKLTGPRPIVFQGRPLNFWRFSTKSSFCVNHTSSSLLLLGVGDNWISQTFRVHQDTFCHLLRILTFHYQRVFQILREINLVNRPLIVKETFFNNWIRRWIMFTINFKFVIFLLKILTALMFWIHGRLQPLNKCVF